MNTSYQVAKKRFDSPHAAAVEACHLAYTKVAPQQIFLELGDKTTTIVVSTADSPADVLPRLIRATNQLIEAHIYSGK